MIKKTNILVIDDEKQIRKLLEITLESNGYNVIQAENAKDGYLAAVNQPVDLIILDLGLPDENGYTLLQKMREWSKIPIIILSAQSGEEAIVKTLDNGANDYLIKPFRTGELLARIRSAIRNATMEKNVPLILYKHLEVNLTARTVKQNNEILKLTTTQYALLVLFAKNEGKVLTHQYVLKEVWGDDYIDKLQYLRVFVAQLRKKIETNGIKYIVTESGIGYRFVAE